ncbi:hypothetical protein N656DRAFT_802085 [Canariomyces notabilis]|uniref:Uncharacterized protein n=1 Tax=Canariomyces notabilis TaxID=2074819 RepID=A0AAN6T822_9PEZI|nr:hypothetical protein N656DRAFT_802085 [Canariomyces arenarius]
MIRALALWTWALTALVVPISARDTGELAADLFSDVAPILALFGEKFAQQFAGESLTWLDNLIFAMVPLGIITTLAGAIRVQGHRLLRAFIGRARENRAVTELELMSSTSKEVCELFNGESVVRALGQPRLAQFIIFPDLYDEYGIKRDENANRTDSVTEDSCGIHTLEMAVKNNLIGKELLHSHMHQLIARKISGISKINSHARQPDLETARQQSEAGNETVGNMAIEDVLSCLGAPNFQLNLSSDPIRSERKRLDRAIAGFLSVVVQAGLLVIAGVVSYLGPADEAVMSEWQPYGFGCYSGGSFLLVFGMWICAHVIQRNTVEFCWTRKAGAPESTPLEMQTRQDLSVENLQSFPGGDEEHTEISKPDDETEHNHKVKPKLRIFWLQQSHSVNDQIFQPVVIPAGAADHIVTSTPIDCFAEKSPHCADDKIQSSKRPGLYRFKSSLNEIVSLHGISIRLLLL